MNQFAPLERFADELSQTYGIPALEIMVTHHGKTVFSLCRGYADEAKKKPLSGHDKYFLYSCTKPMTVTAALHAMEGGAFSLDDPVSRFFPSFADAFHIIDGVRVPVKTEVKIRHLFTMTAGLTYNLAAPPIVELIERCPLASTADIVSVLPLSPLVFEPGTGYCYSLCHDVLAAVVEKATDTPFDEYMAQTIFRPLGMKDTYFAKHGVHDGVVQQYNYQPGKGFTAVPNSNRFALTDAYKSGGAGVVSTTPDYNRFACAMAKDGVCENGERLLSPDTYRLMHTEQLSSFPLQNEFSCVQKGYGYGLGVRVLRETETEARAKPGEFGWDGAAGADLTIDPQNELSIVFMMHVFGWPSLINAHPRLRDLTCECLGI